MVSSCKFYNSNVFYNDVKQWKLTLSFQKPFSCFAQQSLIPQKQGYNGGGQISRNHIHSKALPDSMPNGTSASQAAKKTYVMPDSDSEDNLASLDGNRQ